LSICDPEQVKKKAQGPPPPGADCALFEAPAAERSDGSRRPEERLHFNLLLCIFSLLQSMGLAVGKAKNAATLSVHASDRAISPVSEPDRLMQIAAKAEANPKAGKKSA